MTAWFLLYQLPIKHCFKLVEWFLIQHPLSDHDLFWNPVGYGLILWPLRLEWLFVGADWVEGILYRQVMGEAECWWPGGQTEWVDHSLRIESGHCGMGQDMVNILQNTMHYSMIDFLNNTHKRQSISHLLGWDMDVFLWVKNLVYVLPSFSDVLHLIDGLVQERRYSIANALELRLSCSDPSLWYQTMTFYIKICIHERTSFHTLPKRVRYGMPFASSEFDVFLSYIILMLYTTSYICHFDALSLCSVVYSGTSQWQYPVGDLHCSCNVLLFWGHPNNNTQLVTITVYDLFIWPSLKLL